MRGEPVMPRILLRAIGVIAVVLSGLLAARAAGPVHGATILPTAAFLDADQTVTRHLSAAIDLASAHPADFTITDSTTGASVTVTGVTGLTGATTGQTHTLLLHLGSAPDVIHKLRLSYQGSSAATVIPRDVLNGSAYVYTGNDLGNVY